MSKTIRKHERFDYHFEDDCLDCLQKKKKNKKSGNCFTVCPYDDIRAEALTNGRTKRKRGWK